jgi:hypothetical protein
MLDVIMIITYLSIYAEGINVKLIPEAGTPPVERGIPGFTLNTKTNVLYIYGGISEQLLSDMWEFDLNDKRWREIHSPSVLNPGKRSNPFITVIEDDSKILLFGGNTYSGPISDLWEFNISHQTVFYI